MLPESAVAGVIEQLEAALRPSWRACWLRAAAACMVGLALGVWLG